MKTIDNEEKSSNLNIIKLKFYSFLFIPSKYSQYAADRRESYPFSSFQAERRKIVK